MSFLKNLNKEDKKIIIDTIISPLDEIERGNKIMKQFPTQWAEYAKWFSYKKFCETPYEERNKFYFINVDEEFITGDIYQLRAFDMLLINLNSVLISFLRDRSI